MEQLYSLGANSVRFAIFLSLLISFGCLEFLVPWRKRVVSRKARWFQNLSLTVINTFVAKFTLGAIPLALAVMCAQNDMGLLQLTELPVWLMVTLTYVLLDLLIYFQHMVFHHVPMFWNLHKVHHSDVDLDVTSGFRFHPVEIFMSLAVKSLAVVALGAHPAGVLVFEVLLNAGSLFNHSNFRVPEVIEKYLRLVLVTPKVHLVHHSTLEAETNSNFGFTISVWDRLFGTYKERSSFENFEIGLDDYRNNSELSISRLITIPFEDSSKEK